MSARKYKNKLSEKMKVLIMVVVIMIITGFPYLQKGLCGYFPDLMYHMLRIEGVKDSILQGVFPVHVYENFFNGFGYGSPLFYPDVFLVFPALLRLLNIPPLIAWKVFALCLCVAATLTTWWSLKYITRDSDVSIAATFLIMLSQFYLADLMHRVGLSEYLAFIFLPLLIAGIYDFFAYEGKKIYLLGIALGGLLLSHTIMTFIGVLITVIIFVRMLLTRKSKNFLFDRKRMVGLIVTAICTILCVSYYIFPMLEQMVSDRFHYMTPWAHVGDYVQPFTTFFRMTGYFSHIAYVGIGLPVLLLAIVCIFLKKPKNPWAMVFFLGGVLLFLIETPIIPWEKLNETVLNMIQFPYRFFPYAFFFLVLGIAMILFENISDNRWKTVFLTVIVISAMITGVIQNLTIHSSEESKQIDAQYLAEHTGDVGAGEWLPEGISPEVVAMTADGNVYIGEQTQSWHDAGEYYYFQVEGNGECILPLMYYKGYKAELHTKSGARISLPVERSEQALVSVENESGQSGEIRVWYEGTAIQKIATILSMVTFMILIAVVLIKNILNRRKEKKIKLEKRARIKAKVKQQGTVLYFEKK